MYVCPLNCDYNLCISWYSPGIDADAARNEEEDVMTSDVNRWLKDGYDEEVHPKTGATALHVAAAKGYLNVMK